MGSEADARRRLLLTGFEPFGGDSVNPSKELVRSLDGQTIGRWDVTGVVLPVTYGVAAAKVWSLIFGGSPGSGDNGGEDRAGRARYDAVLSLGLAKGRAKVCLERVAINVRDASLPDHAGHVAQDEPVVPGGPAAYFSTVPLRAMLAAVEAAGVPAAISNTAGTYVCNDLLYSLLHFAATSAPVGGGGGACREGRESGAGCEDGEGSQGRGCGAGRNAVPLRIGFIHVPALPEQVGAAGGVSGAQEAEAPSLTFDEMRRAVVAAIEAL